VRLPVLGRIPNDENDEKEVEEAEEAEEAEEGGVEIVGGQCLMVKVVVVVVAMVTVGDGGGCQRFLQC
jgi:hypothetical protein